MTSDSERKPDNSMHRHDNVQEDLKHAATVHDDNKSPKSPVSKKKGGRTAGTTSFPHNTLEDALRVPRAIWMDNAGHPFHPNDLRNSLKIDGVRAIRNILRSSQMYGLTVGSWSSDPNHVVKLSSTGKAIIGATADADVTKLKIEAMQKPKVFHDFLHSINNRVIPPKERCKSMLVERHHIGSSVAETCYSVMIRNVSELGLVGKNEAQHGVLRLGGGPTETPTTSTPSEQSEESLSSVVDKPDSSSGQDQDVPARDTKPKQIFIAHGKNRIPLEQLEKFLRSVGLKYKVAVNEANAGRPISKKVVELMRQCTSAIFICTADVKIVDGKDEETWWPSQNVIYELGAASFQYGKKIVIFKEDGVDFGSNFSDLGHIKFKKDKLEDKTGDLVQEFLEFGFIQVSAT